NVIGGLGEGDGAAQLVVVGEREGGEAEAVRAGHQRIGVRGAVEQRVRRMAMELDVAGVWRRRTVPLSHTIPARTMRRARGTTRAPCHRLRPASTCGDSRRRATSRPR